MFVFDVILRMSLLAKVGATHCALKLHLSVLRLKFFNIIDKHLSGLTCKLRNCRKPADIDTHSNSIIYKIRDKTKLSFQEMPHFQA